MEQPPIDCSDERTVQMLYLKLGRPALAKTINLVSKSVAEEIVQEVFAKLWQAKPKFTELKQAYAWVYKCCTNSAIDYMRNHNNSHAQLDDSIQRLQGLDLETKTQAQQLWQRLLKIFDDEEASVFIYRNVEGLTQEEVAEVMQISRRTVNRLQEKVAEKLEKIRRQQNG